MRDITNDLHPDEEMTSLNCSLRCGRDDCEKPEESKGDEDSP